MAVSLFLLVSLWLCDFASIFAYHYPSRGPSLRLSKPLVGDDGRVYACSENYFFAFESNGSIAWSVHLDFKCNVAMAPLHGGPGKIYLVAENRVLEIIFGNHGIPQAEAQVFFGPETNQQDTVEIVGVTVSTFSSTLFINLRDRAPVLDQCEASIYISNTEGELYCLSVRSRKFIWIQDFSSLDKIFTVTPGNNGHLYVILPVKALVLALDVFSGNILWQKNIGPLSRADSTPVVDLNGWVSIASLDGFLYSFSPTGSLQKFSRINAENVVIQVDPMLDCSGYAVYVSQTQMEGKISYGINESAHVSAVQPKTAFFTLLVPATGSIYWSESHPCQFSSLLQKSDLSQFIIDEEILLAFFAASKTGNSLQCRTIDQKLTSSCSQARTELVNIYTGNERPIILFLFFESALLAALAWVVRFCCTFWAKRKIQNKGLGSFLEKRRSLRLQKKAFDRKITELKEKSLKKEETGDEIYKKMDDMVQQRQGIERKLSTTYSLGRDKTDSQSKSLLPLYNGREAKSSSFQGEFHTLSDTTSGESSTEEDSGMLEEGMDSSDRAKGKSPMDDDDDTSSDEESVGREYVSVLSEAKASPKLFISSSEEQERLGVRSFEGEKEVVQRSGSSTWLKRRKTSSSIN
ncbi:hypothetical protein K1719_034603 [Acacia pycnantha]|nr:hypothetical protein K1719_034603 [Acacia pycnantha]